MLGRQLRRRHHQWPQRTRCQLPRGNAGRLLCQRRAGPAKCRPRQRTHVRRTGPSFSPAADARIVRDASRIAHARRSTSASSTRLHIRSCFGRMEPLAESTSGRRRVRNHDPWPDVPPLAHRRAVSPCLGGDCSRPARHAGRAPLRCTIATTSGGSERGHAAARTAFRPATNQGLLSFYLIRHKFIVDKSTIRLIDAPGNS